MTTNHRYPEEVRADHIMRRIRQMAKDRKVVEKLFDKLAKEAKDAKNK